MTPLMTRYFCRSQSGDNTILCEDAATAIAEAERRKLAPFTVYEYLEHPIAQRVTNGLHDRGTPEPKHADDAA